MQENEILLSAINTANQTGRFFCKFISANDVGLNGSHQEGVYLNKKSWSVFFDAPIPDNGILDKYVKIHIANHYPFESRVVYYTSKKEFRITQFWTKTPYDKNDAVGGLIVFIPVSNGDFRVYLFNTDDVIEEFIETFSLSLIKNYAVFSKGEQEFEIEESFEDSILKLVEEYKDFPTTSVMAKISRDVYMKYYKKREFDADKDLLKWIETEYTVFRLIEQVVYKDKLVKPFVVLEPLLEFASSAMNRRKARAGRSLEHHVNFIFSSEELPFNNPGKTEANKKPDFLFPSTLDYADESYPTEKLIMLGAKTTCKDRWRQVLSEAERIPKKYLITLQQGISKNQLDEMAAENLTLVVPQPLHGNYPKDYQDRLWSVKRFIEFAKENYLV
jgi:hypothetical protein